MHVRTPELGTFGRPKCAPSDARKIQVARPEVCTFGRPSCARSDVRIVHVRKPEVCTFGRPKCAHSDARSVHTWDCFTVGVAQDARPCDAQERSSSHVSKDLCLVCGLIGPNIGLVGSGVCEKKYRFVLSCVRCCPPLSPERVNVESGFWWPRPE